MAVNDLHVGFKARKKLLFFFRHRGIKTDAEFGKFISSAVAFTPEESGLGDAALYRGRILRATLFGHLFHRRVDDTWWYGTLCRCIGRNGSGCKNQDNYKSNRSYPQGVVHDLLPPSFPFFFFTSTLYFSLLYSAFSNRKQADMFSPTLCLSFNEM